MDDQAMGEVRVTGHPYGACYAGLILQGELAGQYQLDPTNAQVEAQGIGRLQQELWLNELAPITIFVGANNSGKSRLLREELLLFGLLLGGGELVIREAELLASHQPSPGL